MSNENLKERTKQFALAIMRLVEGLPPSRICQLLGGQLVRASSSVGANYRAACRAKSPADFISKLGTVEEEADESAYWLELLRDAGKLKPVEAAPLIQEASELVAIMVASINTARKGKREPTGASSFRTPHSAVRTSDAPRSALPTPPGALRANPQCPIADSRQTFRTPHSALRI